MRPGRVGSPWEVIRLSSALFMLLALVASAADTQQPTSQPVIAPDPDVQAHKAVCFPPERFPRVATHDFGGVVVWTDLPESPKPLEQELKKMLALLEEWLPTRTTDTAPAGASRATTGQAPARPVCLALYARHKDYQELWPRVGRLYAGQFPEITTQGYSYRVFCATSAEDADAAGAWLGVVCHELAHVWLYQRAGLANDGNWLTEGIATALQMRLFPASADRREFAERLERGRCLPLKRLMDQARIEPKDRWQAGTFVELLLAEHAGKLSAVARAFNAGRSASAVVADVLGTDFQTLDGRWARRVRARE